MYDERFVTPMRQELTRLGIEELRTVTDVDTKLKDAKGTTLVVVNSVCGCAARNARPAVASALQNAVKPDQLTTVFAGQDIEATARVRSYFEGFPPSSPQVAILSNRKVLFMLQRHEIEGRTPGQIAAALTDAYQKLASPAA